MIKIRSLRWFLTQDDQCPYKMGEFGYTDRYDQKEDDMKTESVPSTSWRLPATTRS